MRFKQYIATILATAMVVAPTSTVFAEETSMTSEDVETKITEMADSIKEDESKTTLKDKMDSLSLFGTDTSELYSFTLDQTKEGSGMSFSEAFSQLSGLVVPQDSALDFSDMEIAADIDFGTVNLQFATLKANTQDVYTQSSTGKSADCISLFSGAYGNVLEQAALSEPTIPEGFTTTSMLNKANSIISDAYSDATTSGTFGTVKNSISIGSVFAKAQQGLTMGSLASNGTLQGLMSSSVASNEAAMTGKYNAQTNWLNSQRDDVKLTQASELYKAQLQMSETLEAQYGSNSLDRTLGSLGNMFGISGIADIVGDALGGTDIIGNTFSVMGDIGSGIGDFFGDIGSGIGDIASDVGDWFGGLFG